MLSEIQEEENSITILLLAETPKESRDLAVMAEASASSHGAFQVCVCLAKGEKDGVTLVVSLPK